LPQNEPFTAAAKTGVDRHLDYQSNNFLPRETVVERPAPRESAPSTAVVHPRAMQGRRWRDLAVQHYRTRDVVTVLIVHADRVLTLDILQRWSIMANDA